VKKVVLENTWFVYWGFTYRRRLTILTGAGRNPAGYFSFFEPRQQAARIMIRHSVFLYKIEFQ